MCVWIEVAVFRKQEILQSILVAVLFTYFFNTYGSCISKISSENLIRWSLVNPDPANPDSANPNSRNTDPANPDPAKLDPRVVRKT
jgi:hypothetical protein